MIDELYVKKNRYRCMQLNKLNISMRPKLGGMPSHAPPPSRPTLKKITTVATCACSCKAMCVMGQYGVD